MNARMNLFKDIAKREIPKIQVPKQMPLQAVMGLGMFAIVAFSTISSYFSMKRDEADLVARKMSIETQLRTLAEAAEKRAADSAKVVTSTAVSKEISSIHFSWTSILWKIAANTTSNIMIRSLNMTHQGVATPVNGGQAAEELNRGKQIVVEGQAKSVADITRWLEVLGANVPGYEFIVDSHQKIADPRYGVQFKMTARMI